MRELLEKQLRAIEELSGGQRPEGVLGELYDDLKAQLDDARRSGCYPTMRAPHDVPSVEGTSLERTFTGTFIGRLLNRRKQRH